MLQEAVDVFGMRRKEFVKREFTHHVSRFTNQKQHDNEGKEKIKSTDTQ